MPQTPAFTHRPTRYTRRPTRTVWVGQVGVGGNFPIRVQSMTTSDTKDTASIIPEIQGLVNAGCEIVRVTVPTQADCDNLPNIRAEMKRLGLKVPLVADIHFTPSIAMKVVEYVEKVRINPGNFVDKKMFKVLEYTDAQYAEELERLREKFVPLVLKCKEYGVAMRIGTNHGSLSDRIMNRFGDTPEGMVASALEFLEIAEEHDYRDIILSMKASNVQVMITAYRLLARRLAETNRDYPFHLGVTEAGEGEDGRIKSAIGIGSLLEDGIGDTIRVSLTEDSIHEIPVAYKIIQKYNQAHLTRLDGTPLTRDSLGLVNNDSLNYERRATQSILAGQATGGTELVRVWASSPRGFDHFEDEWAAFLKHPQAPDQPIEGVEVNEEHFKDIDLKRNDLPTLAFKSSNPFSAQIATRIAKIVAVITDASSDKDIAAWQPVLEHAQKDSIAFEWCFSAAAFTDESLHRLVNLAVKTKFAAGLKTCLYSVQSGQTVADYRRLAKELAEKDASAPIHLRVRSAPDEGAILQSSIDAGCLLMDGIGDSLQIEGLPLVESQKLSYNILQACRLRISKAEYISCPSCGRTLFDLQTTTERIREKTVHLKGVKIAVMGCIVNGPGEMADADFGYVGTGAKKVSLYVGKDCVERNIPENEAVNRLIALIQSHNRWIEPLGAA